MQSITHICTCGKEYKLFQSYKRHINKRKCNQNLEDFPLEQPIQEHQTPTQGLENTNTNPDDNIYTQMVNKVLTEEEYKSLDTSPESNKSKSIANITCIYCNKLYSKHNIKRHQSVHCKHRYKQISQYKQLVKAGVRNIPEDAIEIIELYNKIMDTQPSLLMNIHSRQSTNPGTGQLVNLQTTGQNPGQIQLDANTQNQLVQQLQSHIPPAGINNINIHNTQNIQNIQNIQNNNSVVQNNNVVQQNINVIINPICRENLSHITPERQKYIILQRKKSIKALIDSIYENLDNHNIFISDRKGKKVKYLDVRHGINNGDAEDIIGDIAMAHLGHLDDYIETHKKDVPEHRKNDLKYLEAFLVDENNNPKVIKQVMDKIECIHNTSKMLLDRYEKMKVDKFITSKTDAPAIVPPQLEQQQPQTDLLIES
jgi:hypothetical protein